MKRTIYLLLLLMSAQFVNGAVVKNDTVKTKSGLKYIITQKNPAGVKPVSGDKIEAHYTGTLTNGKKFDSSRDRNETFSFVIGTHQVIEGWDEGFLYLRKGEKATFVIPAKLGYGSQDMGDIPPNSTLIFDVELVDVQKPEPYTPYSGKGKDTIKLASGLKYIVISQGNPNEKAASGQIASIFYAGYLTNGEKFDGNFGTFGPFDVDVIGSRVIGGWQEILPLMNKGMKIRVIIPPNLGYGEKGAGQGIIPPNATLIFDMYLKELKKAAVKAPSYQPYPCEGKDTIKLASGLKYIVINPGDVSARAKTGQTASIYYAGYLEDGTKFDGNFGSGHPFKLPVVGGQVIAGWQEIIPLMNRGMQLRVIIPSNMGYGEQGYPGLIPPNATLIFDMFLEELL